MRFQNFKLLYRDIEHHDSTSRLLNSMRPCILVLTFVSCFILFEERNMMDGKDDTLWISKLYQRQKKSFFDFKYRLMDLDEREKT